MHFWRFQRKMLDARQVELVLDFSNVTSAYADGMVPLICMIEMLRTDGMKIEIRNPVAPYIHKLFEKSGWYNHLSPKRFTLGIPKPTNFLQRFTSEKELNAAVSQLVHSALQATTMATGVPEALEWIANELAGNILVHAESSVGWIQVTVYQEKKRLSIAVCDSGIGITQSMKRRFSHINNDLIAMEMAIRKEVTSKPEFGQGNGLAGSIAITLEAGGQFTLVSGKAQLVVRDRNVKPRHFNPAFRGTFAELQFSAERPIALINALWGHKPVSMFETHFEDDKGSLHFKLRDYAESFGNRFTGQRIRQLVENLLLSNPSSSIEIDFTDVSVISSSFADELFAKLHIQMGLLQFGRRIKLKNSNSICDGIIERIVEQRIAYHRSKGGNVDDVKFGEDLN
jgi:hypothetical protein